MFEEAAGCVANIRNMRQSKGISPKEKLDLFVKKPFVNSMKPIIEKLANVSKIEEVDSFDTSLQGVNFMVSTTEFFIPVKVDTAAEITKVTAEIERYTKFLASVKAKLSNEKFVAHAPAQVVELEKKKESDATEKIKSLNELLQRLK